MTNEELAEAVKRFKELPSNVEAADLADDIIAQLWDEREKQRVAMVKAKPVEVGELAHHIYDADKKGVLAFVWCEISAQAILSRYNVTLKESV